LRTPLNAILGFSQLMLRDASLTAEQRENLETIGRSGEHLLTLINDVLEMSKIEAGRTTLSEQSLDLHRLLEAMRDMFHLRATDKGLQLILARSPQVPRYVRTDEGKLRQVLMNLLSNAVKFTREGGVTLRVGSEEQDRCALLHFEVEDTGVGIAPHELETLFDPFVQTTSGQITQQGTGLGLAISQEFVKLLGAKITVSSELDVGSVFRFDLRVKLAPQSEVQEREPSRQVIGLEPNQPVYRLLVVEDREASRQLLVKLLASLGVPPVGFEIRAARNGQEAIASWEAWEPHLIWMDMRMPVMDGHQATRHIKSTTRGQATVIIALTASAFEEERKVILSEGCDGFVRKPFREAEIFDALARHLGVRFVYADADAEAQSSAADQTARDATLLAEWLGPETSSALPANWTYRLREAAIQADGDMILDLAEQIRGQHAPAADALGTLVRSFRFDIVMDVAQEKGD
jgi:CheY-like chemotaxis protein/anti-sigma regulatory factor (Ser/Thr protein kinase)